MEPKITKEAEDLVLALDALAAAQERVAKMEKRFIEKHRKYQIGSSVQMKRSGKTESRLATVVDMGVAVHNVEGVFERKEVPAITLTYEGKHGNARYYLHDSIDVVVAPQPPQPVVWNTGRLYQKHGQIIAAIRVEGGIVFNDIARGIDGFIACECDDDAYVQGKVMAGYDYNKYESAFGKGCEAREIITMLGKAAGEQLERLTIEKKGD